MSIMAAELTRLSALVADRPLNTIYTEVAEIKLQIDNCKKLMLSETDIDDAIRRGRARRATR